MNVGYREEGGGRRSLYAAATILLASPPLYLVAHYLVVKRTKTSPGTPFFWSLFFGQHSFSLSFVLSEKLP